MRGIDSYTEFGASALSFSECRWKLIDEKGTGKPFILSHFVSLMLEVIPGALCMLDKRPTTRLLPWALIHSFIHSFGAF